MEQVNHFQMQKRLTGFVLAMVGFSSMALAAYLFVTGAGDRMHLLEVTAYMIVGAICFFVGINFIYDSFASFTKNAAEEVSELEEVSQLQQQWRTIQVSKQPAATSPAPQMSVSEA